MDSPLARKLSVSVLCNVLKQPLRGEHPRYRKPSPHSLAQTKRKKNSIMISMLRLIDLILGDHFMVQGLELELCTEDRLGLLSDITRIFRENSLCIKRALISTKGGKAKDTFYVTDVTGNPVDPKVIDSIRQQIGQTVLQVKHSSSLAPKPPHQETRMGYIFGNLFKARTFQNFKLIRSYS